MGHVVEGSGLLAAAKDVGNSVLLERRRWRAGLIKAIACGRFASSVHSEHYFPDAPVSVQVDAIAL
jgi:hypothetical protein